MKVGIVKLLGASVLLSACVMQYPPFGEIPIKNSSFEVDSLDEVNETEKVRYFKMKAWGGYNHGIYNPSAGQFVSGNAPEGDNVGFLSDKDAYMTQTLDQIILPNRRYELYVFIGLRKERSYETGSYTLQLFAGDALLSEKTARMKNRGVFFEDSLRFSSSPLLPDAQVDQPIKIVIRNVDAGQVTVDDIRLYSWKKPNSTTPSVHQATSGTTGE